MQQEGGNIHVLPPLSEAAEFVPLKDFAEKMAFENLLLSEMKTSFPELTVSTTRPEDHDGHPSAFNVELKGRVDHQDLQAAVDYVKTKVRVLKAKPIASDKYHAAGVFADISVMRDMQQAGKLEFKHERNSSGGFIVWAFFCIRTGVVTVFRTEDATEAIMQRTAENIYRKAKKLDLVTIAGDFRESELRWTEKCLLRLSSECRGEWPQTRSETTEALEKFDDCKTVHWSESAPYGVGPSYSASRVLYILRKKWGVVRHVSGGSEESEFDSIQWDETLRGKKVAELQSAPTKKALAESEPERTIRRTITRRAAGAVFGLKGLVIANIRDESGAHVTIPGDNDDAVRVIVCHGSTEQREKAWQMIEAELAKQRMSLHDCDDPSSEPRLEGQKQEERQLQLAMAQSRVEAQQQQQQQPAPESTAVAVEKAAIEKAAAEKAETERWRVKTATERAKKKDKAAAFSDDSAGSVSPAKSPELQIQAPELEKAAEIEELKAEIKDLQDKISSEKSEKSTGGSNKLTKLGKKMDAAVAKMRTLDPTWTPGAWLQKWLKGRK